MHQHIKQQWVDALRSRTYTQITMALRSQQGYCVLGVLCDLHSQTTGRPWYASTNPHFDYSYYGLNAVPDPLVLRWADLPLTAINVLQRMNDDEQHSFLALADYIENNL